MGNFREKKKLGNILLDSGVVTSEQLEKALEEQKLNKGKKLGEPLVDMGITSEVEIACALTQQLHTEFVTLSEYKIPDKVVNLISEREILDKYVVMPFSFHQDTPSILRVAMADPMDIVANRLLQQPVTLNLQLISIMEMQRIKGLQTLMRWNGKRDNMRWKN